MKMMALILDALDTYNISMYHMPFINEQYYDGGDILGVSTLPHTALSNPMIWGGVVNEDKFWVEKEGGPGEEWVDPARYFDREEGEPIRGAEGFSREKDYEGETFIWDDLYQAGYDARALQVPIVLPPYSFRVTEDLEDSWFPDTQERMAEHIRKKPSLIKEQFDDGADFVATSIQMPDKWLHGIGEEKVTEQWTAEEAPMLDKKVELLVEYCEENDIEWVIFGDHGSPQPGAMKKNGYILPRHRKESIIMSSLEPPTYTDELYEWFLDLYDATPADSPEYPEGESEVEELDDSVEERLENLGYK